MKAILRDGPNNLKTISLEDPEPAPDEVVVRVANVGICGSDIHRMTEANEKWDRIVLGHEFAGTVEAIGSEVTNAKVGDRVAVAPLVPCHKCEFCAQGLYSQCPNYSFIGSRRNGAFADLVNVPAINLVPIPDSLDFQRAALLEPMTVILHPLMMIDNQFGKLDTVVVTGLGAIGLLAVQIFRNMGARNIVVSDIVDHKLEIAKLMGATHTVNVLHQKLEDVTDPLGGANIVFESSGSTPAKQAAVRAARSRGIILLVGTSPTDVSFDAALFERISRKELYLIGSWMNYSAPWPGKEWTTAVDMLDKGLIQHENLITHTFSLDDAQDAMNIIVQKKEPFIKIMFQQ